MREYETIYVIKPDLPEEQIKDLKDKFASSLIKGEGKILHHVDWGKRRLAYPVQKLNYAQYIYLQYLGGGGEVSELERILKYEDSVLKFLTVKLNDAVKVDERIADPGNAPLPPEEAATHRAESAPSRRYGDEGGQGYRRESRPPRESADRGPEKAAVREDAGAPSASAAAKEPAPVEAPNKPAAEVSAPPASTADKEPAPVEAPSEPAAKDEPEKPKDEE